ncbi:MAG: hypothetical protein NZ553_20445 [Caldilinea sp.]|nr:hypothetical protein [Caldilinea sp.]MDW8442857.1 hypothetical protein [Caldilineaceae bacterium]
MSRSAHKPARSDERPLRQPIILDGKELDAIAVAAQRAAQRARARMARALLIALGVGLALIFFGSYWISRNVSADAGIILFLLPAAILFATVYFLNNYWQWRILQALDLRCPHCEEPLGGEIHWTRRPGYHCPHCGKDAIATARQLGDH